MAKKTDSIDLRSWPLSLFDPHAAATLEFYISRCKQSGRLAAAYATQPYLDTAREVARDPQAAEAPEDGPVDEG